MTSLKGSDEIRVSLSCKGQKICLAHFDWTRCHIAKPQKRLKVGVSELGREGSSTVSRLELKPNPMILPNSPLEKQAKQQGSLREPSFG